MSIATLDDRGLIVSCPKCGKRNRVPYGRQGKCGSCGTLLAAPGAPIEVPNAHAFDALIKDSAEPVVVDFWAPWCGPCRMVAPELEKVARTHAGRWLVVKVNTDEQSDLAARYRIQSIPTLAVVHDGREVARVAGVRPAQEIERFVADATAGDARRAS